MPEQGVYAQRAIAYLEVLQLAIEHELNDIIRTSFDNWAAYDKAAKGYTGFVTSSGSPIWFNKVRPIKRREALKRMSFISKNAGKLIKSNSEEAVMVDHSIPVSVLRNRLIEKWKASPQGLSVEQIQRFLRRYHRRGVITYDEDERLSRKGLMAKMPEDWKFSGCSICARYDAVKIKMLSTEEIAKL